jgi:competence protein ComGC
MKPRFSNQRTAALTLVEVLVVIATLAVFVLLIVPAIGTRNYRSKRMMCVSNLRQIGIAYTVWADDNGGKYPRQVSLTNGGAMELIATGNVVACFQVMSNQLPTPKILLCPAEQNTWPRLILPVVWPVQTSVILSVWMQRHTNLKQFFRATTILNLAAFRLNPAFWNSRRMLLLLGLQHVTRSEE